MDVKQEAKQELQGVGYCWLSTSHSASFLIYPQITCLGMVVPVYHGGLSFFHQSPSRQCPTDAAQTSLFWAIPRLERHQMTWGCAKLTMAAN